MTSRRYSSIFTAYLALVSAFLLYVGVDGFRRHDRWAMGDWVTNYEGGFVRRGLPGQIAFDLSHLGPHLSVYFWSFLLELSCYAIVLAVVAYLVSGLSWRLWMVALVYSPATLSFTLFAPTFTFRKEVLFLALLGSIIVALCRRALPLAWLSAFVAVAMVALVLSHEPTFFYYPYIVCAFLIACQSLRPALLAAAPGAVSGLVSFVAAIRHPGGYNTAMSICHSLGGSDLSYEPCSGAIVYMSKTASAARSDVLFAIHYWHLKLVMPFLLVMALGPLLLGLRSLRKSSRLRFSWRSLVLCAVLAWCGSLPLFIYAFDWNRWIYIHSFSCLLLLLMIERQNQGLAMRADEPFERPAQTAIFPARNPARVATAILLAFSLCGWQLSFYHHFPLPGENLATYLSKRVKSGAMNGKLDWDPRALKRR